METIVSAYSSLQQAPLVFALIATFGGVLLLLRVIMMVAAGGLDLGENGDHDSSSPYSISLFGIAVCLTIGGLGGLTAMVDLQMGVLSALALSTLAAFTVLHAVSFMTKVILGLAHPGANVGADTAVGETCTACFLIPPGDHGLVRVEAGGGIREFRACNIGSQALSSGDEALIIGFEGQVLHVTTAQ